MSLLILAAAIALADPSSVQPTPDQIKAAEQKADGERVVCRKELVVGSHRPKKTCLTKAQWKEWEDENKDKLNNQTLGAPDDSEDFGPNTPAGIQPK